MSIVSVPQDILSNGFLSCTSLLPGADNTDSDSLQSSTEVGWYIVDANNQQMGPYTMLELRGEFFIIEYTVMDLQVMSPGSMVLCYIFS